MTIVVKYFFQGSMLTNIIYHLFVTFWVGLVQIGLIYIIFHFSHFRVTFRRLDTQKIPKWNMNLCEAGSQSASAYHHQNNIVISYLQLDSCLWIFSYCLLVERNIFSPPAASHCLSPLFPSSFFRECKMCASRIVCKLDVERLIKVQKCLVSGRVPRVLPESTPL